MNPILEPDDKIEQDFHKLEDYIGAGDDVFENEVDNEICSSTPAGTSENVQVKSLKRRLSNETLQTTPIKRQLSDETYELSFCILLEIFSKCLICMACNFMTYE